MRAPGPGPHWDEIVLKMKAAEGKREKYYQGDEASDLQAIPSNQETGDACRLVYGALC